MVQRIAGGWGARLVFEPGRLIVGNAGILLTRIIRTKPGPVHPFVVVDAAMNDLMRPALYDAWHAIEAVGESPDRRAPTFRLLTGQFVPLTLHRRLTEIAETGHYDMPPVSLHADQVADVAAYINSFGAAGRRDDRPDTGR